MAKMSRRQLRQIINEEIAGSENLVDLPQKFQVYNS